jgi:hypothetical protein
LRNFDPGPTRTRDAGSGGLSWVAKYVKSFYMLETSKALSTSYIKDINQTILNYKSNIYK